MSAWTLYLIGLCDDVSAFFIILFIISMGLYVAKIIYTSCENSGCHYCHYYHSDTKPQKEKYPPIYWLIINIFILLIVTVIPSSKTLTLMVTIPTITQNENFKELPNDIAMYLRKLINESIKEEKSK